MIDNERRENGIRGVKRKLTWYKEGPEISASDCRNGVERRKKIPAWNTMMRAPCSVFPAADLTFCFSDKSRVDGLMIFGRDLR